MSRYATFYEDSSIGDRLGDLNGKRVKVFDGHDEGVYEVEVVGEGFEFTAYASELFDWNEN